MIISLFLFIRAFNATNIVGILRGGGDVKVCLFLDVIPLYVYTVPVAAITALLLKWDIQWVYLLVVCEEIIKIAFGMWRYRSRRWINNITRDFSEA
jgi:Na+-driven multidrug efflux pump